MPHKHNYVLVVLCLYLFLGGVSTNLQAQTTYDVPITAADSIEQTCEKNPQLRGHKTTLKEAQVRTGEQFDFFIRDPNGAVTSYISAAAIKESELQMELTSKALYVGRRGEIIKTISEKSYEGWPLEALAHAVTLGFFFLFQGPVNSAQAMAGCTDRKVTSKAVDISKSVPTDRVKWEDVKATHKVHLSGLGDGRVLDAVAAGKNETVDLRPLILKAAIEDSVELTVECFTCALHEKDTAGQRGGRSNKVVLNVRQEVLAVLAKAQADKELAESLQRRQEEEKQQALLEEQRIAREGDGTPDDEACKKRKLKPSTQPYSKCRSDLVGAREKQEALQLAAEEKKRRAEEARVEKKKLIADSEEIARVATERQVEEKKRKQELASGSNASLGQAGRLSLDASKIKCTELGFKPATEGYGKCVLQLSK